ncbi:MAG: phosphoribosyltransferase family protein [Acidimicrobiales bacterium]
MRFRDRADAGRQLAKRFRDLQLVNPIVLALPRGGVPVAREVAVAIGAPLHVLIARKVGAPGQPEYGIGAVAEGLETPVLTADAARVGLDREGLDALIKRVEAEVDRRVRRYRGDRTLPPLADRDVIIVDDGLATGVTAEAALRAVRQQRPHQLWLAVPVCAMQSSQRLSGLADEVICLASPQGLGLIGSWYEDFAQLTDEEVIAALAAHRADLNAHD